MLVDTDLSLPAKLNLSQPYFVPFKEVYLDTEPLQRGIRMHQELARFYARHHNAKVRALRALLAVELSDITGHLFRLHGRDLASSIAYMLRYSGHPDVIDLEAGDIFDFKLRSMIAHEVRR